MIDDIDPEPMANMRQTTIRCLILLATASLLSLGLLPIGCKREATGGRRAKPGSGSSLQGVPYAGSSKIRQGEGRGVVLCDETRSCPGYSLYSIQMLSKATLIDAKGEVVREWMHFPSQRWENCELLPNGDLLVVGAEEFDWPDRRPFPRIADEARYLLRFNWNGDLLWKRKLLVHHDVEATPGDNLLVLGFQRQRIGRYHAEVDTRDDLLMLLDSEGRVLSTRSMLDAIEKTPAMFPLFPVQPDDLCGAPWLDLLHSNSIEWMRQEELVGKHPIYDTGNILVCFRHQNRIAVFNWAENRVVWSWGQGQLDGPHDAQVLPNGHILVFDNGLQRGFSRAVEMDPTSEKIVWTYQADPPESFYTASKGSVQRLPNGNTLLAESDRGHAFEITPTGEKVWEFFCPEEIDRETRAAIVRMKRYPIEYVEELEKANEKPADELISTK